PTDFSKASRNAINYAAEIAKRAKAKLVLLHAYHPVVIPSETPVVLPMSEEVEKDCMRRLRRIRYQLLTKHGRRFNVELSCSEGLAADVIDKYALEQKADLVVMGTHGVGYLEEKLIGSITSEMIARSKYPVLSVSSTAKFKSIKKVLLATDYQSLSNPTLLDPIKEISDMFNSHIYVLNVVGKENELPTVAQAVEGIKLEQLLQSQNHSFHSAVNTDVVSGINEFIEEKHMDMVVMVPRYHNFFATLFKKRNTKNMAFHAKAPLLTIHN
ncbi:MAG: universal stress protein, partial [Bacteroidia bacterium]|nr:universal stress protein [Bacteroidia bacterium]